MKNQFLDDEKSISRIDQEKKDEKEEDKKKNKMISRWTWDEEMKFKQLCNFDILKLGYLEIRKFIWIKWKFIINWMSQLYQV